MSHIARIITSKFCNTYGCNKRATAKVIVINQFGYSCGDYCEACADEKQKIVERAEESKTPFNGVYGKVEK